MTETETKILELIKNAKNILLFSHIRPDWDAFSSLIMTAAILKENFPEKKITTNIEDGAIENGDYIDGYKDVQREDSSDIINRVNPDLIILTDCAKFTRITRDQEKLFIYYNSSNRAPIIGLDHHAPEDSALPDFVSNHTYSSCGEEIYELFIKKYGFANSPITPKCLAAGIMSDTNSFMFLKNNYKHTFNCIGESIDNGISLDEVDMNIKRYTRRHFQVLSEFLSHCTILEDITYFYISDEFYEKNPEITSDIYSRTKEMVNQLFLRNVSFNKLFFLLYPEKTGYKGSLRALSGTYDTTVFAKEMNGGGHRPASGYFLPDVKSAEEAITKTLEVIKKNKEAALIH